MNLLDEEDSGPQLFSPAQVARARAILAAKENAEQQRRKEIESRKAQAVVIREQKAREKEERMAARAAAQQLARDEKARRKAEQLAQKAIREAEKLQKAKEKEELAALQRNIAQGAARAKKRVYEEGGMEEPKKKRSRNASTARNECTTGSSATKPRSQAYRKAYRVRRTMKTTNGCELEGVSPGGVRKSSSRGRTIVLPQRYNS
jgi:hypothetical protein